MPRIRTVKPDFWNDEKLGQEPEQIMLTYLGTWSFSDDYGVVRSNAVWLKNQIYPYKHALRIDVFSTWLSRLVELKAVIPFTYNGEGFYCIRTFRKHQRVEKPSKARNCPEDVLIVEMEKSGWILTEDEGFIQSGNSRGIVGEPSPPDIGEGSSKGQGGDSRALGFNWEKEKKLFSSNQMFKEQFAMTKRLSMVKIDELIVWFITDLDLKKELKDAGEMQKHFTNWFNKGQREGIIDSRGNLKTSTENSELNGRKQNIQDERTRKILEEAERARK